MLALVRKPAGLGGIALEPCCFCRKLTPFWYMARKVAVCSACARVASALHMPSHKAWLKREEVVEKAAKVEAQNHFKLSGNHD